VWFDECKISKMKSLWMEVATGGRREEADRLKQEANYQFTLMTGEHNFYARRSSSSSSSSGTNSNYAIGMSSDSGLSGCGDLYSSTDSSSEDKQRSVYKKKVSTTLEDLQEYCTKFGASVPHVSINYRPRKGKYRKEF